MPFQFVAIEGTVLPIDTNQGDGSSIRGTVREDRGRFLCPDVVLRDTGDAPHILIHRKKTRVRFHCHLCPIKHQIKIQKLICRE